MMRRCISSAGHYLGGFLACLLGKDVPVISILLTLLFIIYELDEDWWLNDKAFRDIREYLIGMFIGGMLLLLKVI